MKLINEISKIDRFDASWTQIEKREGQTLKQLKSIATVHSVGASTRIEGSKMTNEEVVILIDKLKVSKLEERDEQEVAGYFEALDTISESYKDIDITEGNIKNLHNILMSFSDKDEWHRGKYKQLSNSVEAELPNGTKQLIFKTSEPGLPTEQSMKDLFEWYHSDNETNSIIKSALFVYDFLSIHPFQDGNGRLSRLLGTLLLLRNGYSWVQYISFEHEIESRKDEYYKVLMNTQKQRPNEDVYEWISFFMDCLSNIQNNLMKKLDDQEKSSTNLSPRDKNILSFIANYPGSKSSDISKKLNIPLSTVKKVLTSMFNNKLIQKHGVGAGTNYIAEKINPVKPDLMFKLHKDETIKEFLLMNSSSYIEIKKIILIPLFEWKIPDDWSIKLMNSGLYFKITGLNKRGDFFSQKYSLMTFNNPHNFKPVFTLNNPIRIPYSIELANVKLNEFPIKISIELFGSVKEFDFDIMFVYDEV